MNNRAHIIAEAGVNHNGKVENARLLIKIASDCGADSVKFQIINPYGLYLPGDYNYGHYDIKEVIKNRFSTVLSDESYKDLANYCNSLNLGFSGSVFDIDGVNLLASLNPPYMKIASTDLTNFRLLRQVSSTKKKIILSTGMADLREIEKSLKFLDKLGASDIILLHCVSIYPCPLDKTNLSFIKVLKRNFGFEVGFSDHTRTNEASVVAYCLGARWFEKHFTFDNSLKGFDHKHAQNKTEFKSYVNSIRGIEQSLGDNKKKITKEESYTAQRARRSLYAARDMNKGETIKDKDILCVRPSGPLNANQIDLLIGKKLIRNITKHQPFLNSDFD